MCKPPLNAYVIIPTHKGYILTLKLLRNLLYLQMRAYPS